MGVIDKLTGALEDAASGVGKAASALSGGAEHAAADAFKGAVDGVKSAASGVEHAAGDVAKGAIHAGHDVVEGARHGDLAGGLRRAGGDLAKGAGLAVSDHFHGMADAVGHVAHGASAAVRDAGVAAGKAYDGAVDGGSRAVGDVAGARAGALVHGLAEGLAEPVRQTANFDYGVVTGAGDGLGTLVRSTGDLVVGGVRMGTDAEFRDHLIAKAEHVASAVAKDPGGAAKAVGHAAEGAWKHFVAGGEAAARNGTLSEYVGHATGEVGFTIATTIGAPETKVGQVANLAGDVGRAAETLGDAGRVANVLGDAGETAKVAGEAEKAGNVVGGIAREARSTGITTSDADHLAPFGKIAEINNTNGIARSEVNCVQCAHTVDQWLATGEEAGATLHNPHVNFDMHDLGEIGTKFGAEFKPMAGRADVEQALLAQGEGARGIVAGLPAHDGPFGHVWNAIVHEGRVRYLDGQIGGDGAANFVGYPRTALAITGKANDGVFHMASVAERNAHADAWVAKAGSSSPAEALASPAVELTGISAGLAARRDAIRAMTDIGGSAKKIDQAALVNHLAKVLPTSTQKILEDAGTRITVLRYGDRPTLSVSLEGKSIRTYGQYDPATNTAWVATTGFERESGARARGIMQHPDGYDVALHEVGHALDHVAPGARRDYPLSDTDKWEGVIDAERAAGNRFTVPPSLRRYAEAWTHGFDQFLRDPKALQAEHPFIHNYFQNLLEEHARLFPD